MQEKGSYSSFEEKTRDNPPRFVSPLREGRGRTKLDLANTFPTAQQPGTAPAPSVLKAGQS